MRDKMKQLTKKIFVAMTLMTSFGVVHAAYPDQPITVIVPFPPGIVDGYARLVAMSRRDSLPETPMDAGMIRCLSCYGLF